MDSESGSTTLFSPPLFLFFPFTPSLFVPSPLLMKSVRGYREQGCVIARPRQHAGPCFFSFPFFLFFFLFPSHPLVAVEGYNASPAGGWLFPTRRKAFPFPFLLFPFLPLATGIDRMIGELTGLVEQIHPAIQGQIPRSPLSPFFFPPLPRGGPPTEIGATSKEIRAFQGARKRHEPSFPFSSPPLFLSFSDHAQREGGRTYITAQSFFSPFFSPTLPPFDDKTQSVCRLCGQEPLIPVSFFPLLPSSCFSNCVVP